MAAATKQNRGDVSAQNLEPVFKKVQPADEMGALVIRRASKFEAEGILAGTIVAEGIYETRKPNKFDQTKFDYYVRGNDKTLYILGETAVLRNQMDEVANLEGCPIRITYEGQGTTKKGKPFHNWLVEIA